MEENPESRLLRIEDRLERIDGRQDRQGSRMEDMGDRMDEIEDRLDAIEKDDAQAEESRKREKSKWHGSVSTAATLIASLGAFIGPIILALKA